MTIYEKLYAEAAERMSEAKMTFSVSGEAYSLVGGKDPFNIRIEEASDLRNELFFQYFYYRFFNELPKGKSFCRYRKIANVLHLNKDIAFELLLANHIIGKKDAIVRAKRFSGIREYREKKLQQGIISKNDKIKLIADEFFAKLSAYICGYIAYPLWMMMPQKTRETIKQKIRRKG